MKESIDEKKRGSDLQKSLDKWKVPFIILLTVGTLIVIAGAFVTISAVTLGYILISAGLIFLGLTMLFFPFATSRTFQIWGIITGKVIVRVFGVILIILGLIIIFLMSF